MPTFKLMMTVLCLEEIRIERVTKVVDGIVIAECVRARVNRQRWVIVLVGGPVAIDVSCNDGLTSEVIAVW